jgi:hypothetical protein
MLSGHGRSGREGKGGWPSILTTTRYSGRACSMAGSGGTAARRAPEHGGDGGSGADSGARVCGRGSGCGLGWLGLGSAFYKGATAASGRAGPRRRRRRKHGGEPDSGLSPVRCGGDERPDRRAPPVSARERREGGGARGWWAGEKKSAGPAGCAWKGREREREREAMGRAVRGRKRRRRERKEEREMGQPKSEREREKERKNCKFKCF